jgi:hypothetical protein
MPIWENIMNRRIALMLTGAVAATAWLAFGSAPAALAQTLTAQQQLAFDIYKELVEINTVTATGDTGRAADAMAARLRTAGLEAADVQVFKPAPRKGNLVARLRGTGARKPILLLAHLDVVEALPADWSFDPFKLTEKDGYYYGRGSLDDKFMAATFVSNLIRYKQEGFRPDRDIILQMRLASNGSSRTIATSSMPNSPSMRAAHSRSSAASQSATASRPARKSR